MEDFSSKAWVLKARVGEGRRLHCKPAVDAILNSAASSSSASHPKELLAKGVTALREIHFQSRGPYTRFSTAAKVFLCKINGPFEYKIQNSRSMQTISMQKLLSGSSATNG